MAMATMLLCKLKRRPSKAAVENFRAPAHPPPSAAPYTYTYTAVRIWSEGGGGRESASHLSQHFQFQSHSPLRLLQYLY